MAPMSPSVTKVRSRKAMLSSLFVWINTYLIVFLTEPMASTRPSFTRLVLEAKRMKPTNILF